MAENRYLTGTPKLPASMNREVGAILTRWAYLEQHLLRTCYLLLGVTMEQGRLAVQQVKAHEQPNRIGELAALRKIKVDEGQLKSMADRMEEIGVLRNALAHGVWFFSPDHRVFALSVTSGSWPEPQHAHRFMRKKKVRPEGNLIDVLALRAYRDQIDQLIDDARALRSQILEARRTAK